MTQFNIKTGDEVAVFSFWADRPKKSTVELVTPTGKIRVKGYESFLLTPKYCYHRDWSCQTKGHRCSTITPWTERHDQVLEDHRQKVAYDAKVVALRDAVARLHHTDHAKIDAAYELLCASENK